MNSFHKYYRWLVPLVFIIMMLVNYLSTTGIIFPATQAEVSDKYVNLVAPAGFTFSIWGIIYLGMIAVISIDFLKLKDAAFVTQYRLLIQPRMLEWMALNILWIISWSYEWLLVSLIILLLYTNSLMRLVTTVSRTPALRVYPWLLKYPLGLHLGWLMVASLANLTIYLVSRGVDGTGFWGIIWAVGILIALLAVSAYYYTRYGNELIMIPTLWTLIGVFAKHSPMSDFQHNEPIIMYISAVLFVAGIVLYIYLFRLQRTQKEKAPF